MSQFCETDIGDKFHYLMVQQIVHIASAGATSIRVISDDTDVFALLLHFFQSAHLTCDLIMVGTSHTRRSVDIRAAVQRHDQVISSVLAAHVFTRCDTVSYFWGIGKGAVVNNVRKDYQLKKLGDLETYIMNVISEATLFFAGCYGSK